MFHSYASEWDNGKICKVFGHMLILLEATWQSNMIRNGIVDGQSLLDFYCSNDTVDIWQLSLEEFSNLFGLAKENKDAVNKTKHCVYIHTFGEDDQKQRITSGYVANQFKEVKLENHICC